jgi:hypothetical protein
MPEQGKPIEPDYNYRDKCYKKKGSSPKICSKPINISQERWEAIFGITEEERLQSLKQFKCLRVKQKEVNCPNISKWNPEWSYMATGYRMSKRKLKDYCKRNGKIWENS